MHLYSGVLQGKAIKGMSGGPVLNAQCGVVGIISARGKNTAFSSLDDVDAWLLGSAQGWAQYLFPPPPPPHHEPQPRWQYCWLAWACLRH